MPGACAPSSCPGARLAVVGAGFIGQEVAATARGLGVEVTMIEALDTPLAPILGDGSAAGSPTCTRRGRADAHRRGSRAPAGTAASRSWCSPTARRSPATRSSSASATAPATAWLAGSGLEPGGIRTDTAGRTSVPGRLRRRRRLAALRPALRHARPHRALGRGRLAGRGRRPGDARRLPRHAAAAELLERPVRARGSSTSGTPTTQTTSSSRAIPEAATSRPSSPAAAVPIAGLAVGRPAAIPRLRKADRARSLARPRPRGGGRMTLHRPWSTPTSAAPTATASRSRRRSSGSTTRRW